MIIIKDANGYFVPVQTEDIFEILQKNSITILGMSIDAIHRIRTQMLIMNLDPSNEQDLDLFLGELSRKRLQRKV